MKLMIKMMLVAILATIAQASSSLSEGFPEILNYQGTLTDNAGQPISGTEQVTFKIYDVASGGTAVWTETQDVTITEGRFSVVLGSDNPLDANMFGGETYLGISVGNNAEMVPRQKLTSVPYAFWAAKAVSAIPSGGIIMWHGSADGIPEGWALCDGENGTPNLTGRFIIGANSDYPLNIPGGSATKNLSHTHTGPSHTHTIPNNGYLFHVGGGGYSNSVGVDDGVNAIRDHNHGGTTGSSDTGNTGIGGSSSQDILPPYYALCFIMKL